RGTARTGRRHAGGGCAHRTRPRRMHRSKTRRWTTGLRQPRTDDRGAAAAAHELAGAHLLVPARPARRAGARIEVEPGEVQPLDVVGLAERALQPAVVVTHRDRPYRRSRRLSLT